MFELIISHDNGALLNDNVFVAQLAEMLKDGASEGKGQFSGMLSEEKILRTMTRTYFQFIGTLSKTKIGMEIMHKHSLFDYLIPLSVLSGRDDLCNLTIDNLDYNTHGPCRVVLAKSLNAQSQVVRYLATKRLQFLMRSGVSDFSEWGIKFLVQRLSDSSQKVSSFALGILNEAACNTVFLESLINKKPVDILLGMGKAGKDLLTRFLSRSSGFSLVSIN